MKTYPASVVVTVVVGGLALALGFIVGFMLRALSSDTRFADVYDALSAMQAAGRPTADNGSTPDACWTVARDDAAIRQYMADAAREACRAVTCQVGLPNVYVVHKLTAGHIELDGRLDDAAWREVAWTTDFVDMRGDQLPAPRLETRVKLRWDSGHLYVGGYLQGGAVWANRTLHDSTVYQDNSFQVFLDAAQSNHKYKEISVNALGTVSDVMLTKPYMDGGEPLTFWESDVTTAVYTDGPVNDASGHNTFWTVEMAIPFSRLYQGLGRDDNSPVDGETWRANFVRSDWQTDVVGDQYHKRLDQGAEWWAWQSPGVANIHLPDRWGLLQFHDSDVNTTDFRPDAAWVTTNALIYVYRAQKAYKAVTGRYADTKDHLHLPPFVLSKRCIRDLDIQPDWSGFRVTATPADGSLPVGHTRTDRLVWFGELQEEFASVL